MPRTLSEVLHEYAVTHHQQVEERRALRDEWVAAVRQLVNQIKEWLALADKDGVLRIDPEVYELGEESLGWYEAPGLTVYLGPRKVRLKPVGRATTGRRIEGVPGTPQAQGRVDLTAGGTTFMLFRSPDDAGERWYVVSQDGVQGKPLTRDSFDEAMARLLG